MTNVKLKLPEDLVASLEKMLVDRAISIDELVRVYLRAAVNAYENGKCLSLDSVFRFGKYYGETVSAVLKADPGYIHYLLGSSRPTNFDPEVLELLKERAQ